MHYSGLTASRGRADYTPWRIVTITISSLKQVLIGIAASSLRHRSETFLDPSVQCLKQTCRLSDNAGSRARPMRHEKDSPVLNSTANLATCLLLDTTTSGISLLFQRRCTTGFEFSYGFTWMSGAVVPRSKFRINASGDPTTLTDPASHMLHFAA